MNKYIPSATDARLFNSSKHFEGTYKYFLPEVYYYNLLNSITMVTTIVLFLFWGSILEVSGKIHVEVSSKIVLTFN